MPTKQPKKKKNEAAQELGKLRFEKAGREEMKRIGKKGLEKRWQRPEDSK